MKIYPGVVAFPDLLEGQLRDSKSDAVLPSVGLIKKSLAQDFLKRAGKQYEAQYKVNYSPQLEFLMPDRWMVKFVDLPMIEVLLGEMPKYS